MVAPVLVSLMIAPVVAVSKPSRPKVFTKCVKCHGEVGQGGTRAAPDLATTRMTFKQFKTQVRHGSGWKNRPPKNPRYRWKKMPAQIGVDDTDLEKIYSFIKSR